MYTGKLCQSRDNSGMYYFMPRQHLPEWQEEVKWAPVHRGSWVPNKGLENTILAMSTAFK